MQRTLRGSINHVWVIRAHSRRFELHGRRRPAIGPLDQAAHPDPERAPCRRLALDDRRLLQPAAAGGREHIRRHNRGEAIEMDVERPRELHPPHDPAVDAEGAAGETREDVGAVEGKLLRLQQRLAKGALSTPRQAELDAFSQRLHIARFGQQLGEHRPRTLAREGWRPPLPPGSDRPSRATA